MPANHLLVCHVVFRQQDQRSPGQRVLDRQSLDGFRNPVIDIGFDQRTGASGGDGDGVDERHVPQGIAVQRDAIAFFNSGAAPLAFGQHDEGPPRRGKPLYGGLLTFGAEAEVKHDDVDGIAGIREAVGRIVFGRRGLGLDRPMPQVPHHRIAQRIDVRDAQGADPGQIGIFRQPRFLIGQFQENFDGESRAGTDLAVDRDLSAHQVGQPFTYSQAKAGAAETARRRALGLRKRFEELALRFLRYTDTLIDHRYLDADRIGFEIDGIGPDDNLALFRKFHRIAGQIEDDLA